MSLAASPGRAAAAEATARTDRAVHGVPQRIQYPTEDRRGEHRSRQSLVPQDRCLAEPASYLLAGGGPSVDNPMPRSAEPQDGAGSRQVFLPFGAERGASLLVKALHTPSVLAGGAPAVQLSRLDQLYH
ncbi:hypothetical protein HPB47_014999 [Ixodes persulcatus]|uniref:Uncharacterized protein n=1 Tax=Ixodes persulcatus TaxID=34615 RepID=A0AC60QUR0_IXOPE|nr:hypothetical protein HPB47_014999 [Ixodes persulcatus]